MRHAYQISREDSGAAPDKQRTVQISDDLDEVARCFAEECACRVRNGSQKAVITIERIVVDD